jgi:hypothetical protein
MGDEPTSLPAPIDGTQEYLAAILDELRGLRVILSPPAVEPEVAEAEPVAEEPTAEHVEADVEQTAPVEEPKPAAPVAKRRRFKRK